MFGAGGGTSSYQEVEETDVIFLWGSNARETHPIFFHHVLKAVHAGARLFAVDPRRTGSAQWADAWLGIDVGTDVALSNTMAREILHAGLHNREFIDRARVRIEVDGAALDEVSMRQSLMNDLSCHRVGQCDIGSHVEPDPDVSELGRRRASRVDDEQARAIA